MKPYFYVYKVGGNPPKHKHNTPLEAQMEAERLAAKHPDASFEVLACVGISSAQKPKASTFWLDGKIEPVAPIIDGYAELPFPKDFPKLPPLPRGKTRWVYRGKFEHNSDPSSAVQFEDREIMWWDGATWGWTYTFSLDAHHIEAI